MEEVWKRLIDDVTQLLDDIMKVFMRELKKPTLMVPCPLCPILHITLKEVSSGNTIFCPHSDDEELPSDYYGDLIPESSDHIPKTGDPTLIPRRDDTIPRRDDTIPRRDDTIPRRDDTIPRRDDNIPRRDDTIPRRDDTIPRRDDTIPRRDDTIPRRDDSALRTGIVTSLRINIQCDCYSVS